VSFLKFVLFVVARAARMVDQRHVEPDARFAIDQPPGGDVRQNVGWGGDLGEGFFRRNARIIARERVGNRVREYFGTFGAALGTLSPFCSVFAICAVRR
jgi:hypothetical protein